MASRAYIAKINPDGSGKYVYLGHGCYPDHAGIMLLENYQDGSVIDALIAKGSISHLSETIAETEFYYGEHEQDWNMCSPALLEGGTERFFGTAYMPGPEWLYAWTPDGWLAAEVQSSPPHDWINNLGTMSPEAYQDWFDHNQQPEWVAWRAKAMEKQRPQPLNTVIEQYALTKNAGARDAKDTA